MSENSHSHSRQADSRGSHRHRNAELHSMKSTLRAILRVYKQVDQYLKKNNGKKLVKATKLLHRLIDKVEKKRILIGSEDARIISSVALDITMNNEVMSSFLRDRLVLSEIFLHDDPKTSPYNKKGEKEITSKTTRRYRA